MMDVTLWLLTPSINGRTLLGDQTQLPSMSSTFPSSALVPSCSHTPSDHSPPYTVIRQSKKFHSYPSIASSTKINLTSPSSEVDTLLTFLHHSRILASSSYSHFRNLSMPPQPVDQEKCIYCGNYFAEYKCGCQKPVSSINRN